MITKRSVIFEIVFRLKNIQHPETSRICTALVGLLEGIEELPLAEHLPKAIDALLRLFRQQLLSIGADGHALEILEILGILFPSTAPDKTVAKYGNTFSMIPIAYWGFETEGGLRYIPH